ncbi:DUF4365 domain-containing protein [Arthrobacter sp. I2-34]|uniref:DUF4365 domain-containing protein n=1 Tax=Arthrobacter hankyongi TaxID=2904801 RepID=A0ABS9L8I5_9MICC|nr:DUF4365 domain-containing protein [Arthrobacter hankyongi]MCG2622988.1 DUF4365 domain-containing protein [Arthrobacter hankyongi]
MVNQWHKEEAGVLAVQMAAHTAGLISRDQTKHDFGIDLQFELTDDRGDGTGRLLAVQIKTGKSYFSNPTTDGWWFYISERHARYWLNHSLPVILALHDDRNEATYWVRVASDTIESTETGGSKVLVPSGQVLDESAFAHIARFAERRRSISTGTFVDTPGRHRVVMKEAMEAAARDDARIAFELAQGTGTLMVTDATYHMGDPMGRYVLTAYREFDEFLALVLVVNHLTSLNKLLESVNEPCVRLQALLKGFAMAMPNDAHLDEVEHLKQYIALNAATYWGGAI